MSRRIAHHFSRTLRLLITGLVVIGTLPTFVGQSPAMHERMDIAGDWQGTLEFPPEGNQPASRFRLILKISKADNGGWSALNFSIDQGPSPMQTSAVTLHGNVFRFSIPALNGAYEGQLNVDGNSMAGTWTQTTPLPLTFVRATKETAWEMPKLLPPVKPMAEDADPSFEVATVKPSNPDSQDKFFRVSGRKYLTQNTSLADLIKVGYGIHLKQIKGGPAWMDNDKFDLVIVPDGEGQPSGKQWKTIIQKLLVARFKLSFHQEKQDLSAYVLSVGKNGPKNLTKSESNSLFPSLEFQPGSEGLVLPAKNATMTQFAQMMQQVVLDRPVVDQTGLIGRFDFELTFTPDDSQFSGHAPSSPHTDTANSPGLFEALQQQVGLRLTVERIPVDVFVVDRVEKPSAN